MKRLKVIGYGGTTIVDTLLNVEGDDTLHMFHIPLYLPVVSISLSDVDEDEQDVLNMLKEGMECWEERKKEQNDKCI